MVSGEVARTILASRFTEALCLRQNQKLKPLTIKSHLQATNYFDCREHVHPLLFSAQESNALHKCLLKSLSFCHRDGRVCDRACGHRGASSRPRASPVLLVSKPSRHANEDAAIVGEWSKEGKTHDIFCHLVVLTRCSIKRGLNTKKFNTCPLLVQS